MLCANLLKINSWSICFLAILSFASPVSAGFSQNPAVKAGVDVFFEGTERVALENQRIGLVTNHSALDKYLMPTHERFMKESFIDGNWELTALFSPEHGFLGNKAAYEQVGHDMSEKGVPIYSLHGKQKRPTEDQLSQIDLLFFDIQDIGVRNYTYSTTLFYVMEEAAKQKLKVVVLDRPNPINGLIVDGPMLDPSMRSFTSYIDVPFCHGMTIGELALFFNSEYGVGCDLLVVSMEGWQREMSFEDTGLEWVPLSPNIPEVNSPIYYAGTNLIGEVGGIEIGLGYNLPFKIIGAPWIEANELSRKLNSLELPGIFFQPWFYKAKLGRFKGEECEGVRLIVTEKTLYRPLTTQFYMIDMLKRLYPKQYHQPMETFSRGHWIDITRAFGIENIRELLEGEASLFEELVKSKRNTLKSFESLREKYLISSYSQAK